jgi:hypothetical protein
MSTRAQRRASRINAEKSTGARTPQGKAASSLNAVRHGLCSQQAVLPGEDAEALSDLSREFYKSIRPVGPQELFCVEKMILAYWRMRRIAAMEAEIFQAPAEDDETPNPIATRDKRLSLLMRYETSLQRMYDRSHAEVRNLQAMRGNTNEPPIACEAPTIETEKSEISFVSQNPEIPSTSAVPEADEAQKLAA